MATLHGASVKINILIGTEHTIIFFNKPWMTHKYNKKILIHAQNESNDVFKYLPIMGMNENQLIHLDASDDSEVDLTLADFIPHDLVWVNNKIVGIWGSSSSPKKIRPPRYFKKMVADEIAKWNFLVKTIFTADEKFEFTVLCPPFWTDFQKEIITSNIKIVHQNIRHCGSYWKNNPRNTLIIDTGYSGVNISLCEYFMGDLPHIYQSTDPQLGGKYMDLVLFQHFRKEMMKFGIPDPCNELKTRLELMGLCVAIKERKNTHFIAFNHRFELSEDLFYTFIDEYYSPKINIMMERVFARRLQVLQLDESMKYEGVKVVILTGRAAPLITNIIVDYFRKRQIRINMAYNFS